MTSLAYVDASALIKLVVVDVESAQMLRWYVESERVVTSRVGIVETRRAAARHPHDRDELQLLLTSVEVIEFDERLAERAASVGPIFLRALDAIHLATALAFGSELEAFVTYDDRLAEAARAAGLPVVRPA